MPSFPLIAAIVAVTVSAAPAPAGEIDYRQELDRYRSGSGAVGATVTAHDNTQGRAPPRKRCSRTIPADVTSTSATRASTTPVNACP